MNTSTCIVGYVRNSMVFIGGDSAGVSGYDITIRSDEKVFKNDKMIFGFTDSFRMGQLLRYSLKIPKQPKSMEDVKYMSTKFIDAVRACLKKGGYANKTNEVETGGTFLVGYKGCLYTIYKDYQVAKHVKAYHAIGCGAKYAIGAIDTFIQWVIESDDPGADAVEHALKIAAKYSGGVRGPFNIVSI